MTLEMPFRPRQSPGSTRDYREFPSNFHNTDESQSTHQEIRAEAFQRDRTLSTSEASTCFSSCFSTSAGSYYSRESSSTEVATPTSSRPASPRSPTLSSEPGTPNYRSSSISEFPPRAGPWLANGALGYLGEQQQKPVLPGIEEFLKISGLAEPKSSLLQHGGFHATTMHRCDSGVSSIRRMSTPLQSEYYEHDYQQQNSRGRWPDCEEDATEPRRSPSHTLPEVARRFNHRAQSERRSSRGHRDHLHEASDSRVSKRSRKKNGPHINKPYPRDQMDFIRYQQIDLGLPWKHVENLFAAMFGHLNPQIRRETPGVQGVFYRENKHDLPMLDKKTNAFVYNETGHVPKFGVKVRQQGDDKKLYGLVNLYPDRAMKYSWVSPADRELAAKIDVEREQTKAEARQHAIERGTFVEVLPDGVCACCPRRRDNLATAADQGYIYDTA